MILWSINDIRIGGQTHETVVLQFCALLVTPRGCSVHYNHKYKSVVGKSLGSVSSGLCVTPSSYWWSSSLRGGRWLRSSAAFFRSTVSEKACSTQGSGLSWLANKTFVDGVVLKEKLWSHLNWPYLSCWLYCLIDGGPTDPNAACIKYINNCETFSINQLISPTLWVMIKYLQHSWHSHEPLL